MEAIKGVFTGELKLSESPVLGHWNISVNIHGQTYNKTFEVAEYIYPKFIVDIQTAKHVTFKENIIKAEINTRYFYSSARIVLHIFISFFITITNSYSRLF